MAIWTNLGEIAIYRTKRETDRTPVILLHGVYLDHHLWDRQVNAIKDRTVITLDMPLHGKSRLVFRTDWSLDDCAHMLLEILDYLQIPKVIAVGHSWGSMTILRAAHRHPDRFESVLLCNMPFLPATTRQRWTFKLQHPMLAFRDFYARQAARALFAKGSLAKDPQMAERLKRTMRVLSSSEVKAIDRKVILESEDATDLIRGLTVKARALKGVEDYVPTPPRLETILVPGGHISPWEAPEDVLRAIMDLMHPRA